jgi:hypothetical protein
VSRDRRLSRLASLSGLRRFAATTATLVVIVAGCRRHAVRRPARHGEVTVERKGAGKDRAAEAAARALDAQLGGACPRRITLAAGASAERDRSATAAACVDAALRATGVAPSRGEPWRTALIELLALDPEGPTAAARRALAREIVARGGGKQTLERTAGDHATPDPRATAAVAFAFVEVLAARPEVGVRGALRFVTTRPGRGIKSSLAAPPLRLDAETLLSVARAALLSRPATPGPTLVEARWDDANARLVARFDRPLLVDAPVEARVCGETVLESTRPSPSELVFAVDRTRLAGCPVVDGATLVRFSVGEAPWSAPFGASDGALAKPAHARVVLP